MEDSFSTILLLHGYVIWILLKKKKKGKIVFSERKTVIIIVNVNK